jgi:hypothetical protein
MVRAPERFIPAPSVRQVHHDDGTVLTSSRTGERHALTPAAAEVWALLQAERQTVDRLVIALARRSAGQNLAEVPDVVREQLDTLVQRGLVERVVEV